MQLLSRAGRLDLAIHLVSKDWEQGELLNGSVDLQTYQKQFHKKEQDAESKLLHPSHYPSLNRFQYAMSEHDQIAVGIGKGCNGKDRAPIAFAAICCSILIIPKIFSFSIFVLSLPPSLPSSVVFENPCKGLCLCAVLEEMRQMHGVQPTRMVMS